MIDDDLLSDLFARAADELAPPASGPADILQKALEGAETPDGAEATADDSKGLVDLTARRAQRTARFVRTHRVVSAAASVVLVFIVVGGATWIGSNPAPKPPSNFAIGTGPVATTTTLPGSNAAIGSPPSSFAQGSAGSGAVGAPRPAVSGGSGAAAHTGSASAGTTPLGVNDKVAPNGTNGASSVAPGSSVKTTAPIPNNVGQSARIQQTGSLSLTVPKGAVAKTMNELTFLAIRYGGFVANSQTQTGAVSVTGAPSGDITLQVPVGNFSDLLSKAQALGKTNDLTTKATDVTGQYTDLQQRITALQASRQSYLTILAKATSIGDVLAVQSQLDNIQSQIEQLQGQLQLLSSETDYSTVNIEVTQVTPKGHPAPSGHRSGLSTAWHDSVHGFVVGVEGIVRLAGPVLFTLLLGAALLLGGRVLWRRYQRHTL